MVEALKSRMEWLRCPKCRYSCVIGFHDGKIEEINMSDA